MGCRTKTCSVCKSLGKTPLLRHLLALHHLYNDRQNHAPQWSKGSAGISVPNWDNSAASWTAEAHLSGRGNTSSSYRKTFGWSLVNWYSLSPTSPKKKKKKSCPYKTSCLNVGKSWNTELAGHRPVSSTVRTWKASQLIGQSWWNQQVFQTGWGKLPAYGKWGSEATNTTSINMWCTETLLHGGFKSKKSLSLQQLTTVVLRTGKRCDKRREKRTIYGTRAGVLTCWLVNSLKAYIVAGTLYPIHVHWGKLQRLKMLKISLCPLMCQWRRVTVEKGHPGWCRVLNLSCHTTPQLQYTGWGKGIKAIASAWLLPS